MSKGQQFKSWVLPQVEGNLVIGDHNSLAPPTVKDLEQWAVDARDEGFKQGYEQSKQAIEAQKQQWLFLIKALDYPLKNLDKSIADTVFNLSITIAQQLVKKTLQVDPDEIIDLVKDCIEVLAEDNEKLKISLHPTDAILVRSYLEEINEINNYKITEDISMTLGGCIVQSKTSTLDATLEHRFSAQFEHLMEHKDDLVTDS